MTISVGELPKIETIYLLPIYLKSPKFVLSMMWGLPFSFWCTCWNLETSIYRYKHPWLLARFKQLHEESPKVSGTKHAEILAILGVWGFPYISRIHTAYRWGFLHCRYLECSGERTTWHNCNGNWGAPFLVGQEGLASRVGQGRYSFKMEPYTYLEPVCPLLLQMTPPKQGLFPSKQGSFWFQVYGCFQKIGVGLQNEWFIMDIPIKMGWFGGKTHHFRKHPYGVMKMLWDPFFCMAENQWLGVISPV